MKKQLLISAMALLVISATIPSASAQNGFQKGLKNVGQGISQDSKTIFNDLKSSAKKDVENTTTLSSKDQIKSLKEQKKAKLKPLEDSICVKKKEISKVKNSDYITETERTAKLIVLKKTIKSS